MNEFNEDLISHKNHELWVIDNHNYYQPTSLSGWKASDNSFVKEDLSVFKSRITLLMGGSRTSYLNI